MTGKLTQSFVDAATPGSYGDGRGSHGLRLVVTDTGKSWTQRLRIDGKPTNKGLGGASTISLAQARQMAAANAGAAPMPTAPAPAAADTGEVERLRLELELERARAENLRLELELTRARQMAPPAAPALAQANTPTVAEVLELVIADRRSSWRSPKTEGVWRRQLGQYCADLLATPVGDVTPAMVRDALAMSSPNIAGENRRRLSAVFRWAIVDGHRTDDPTVPVTVSKRPEVEHREALPPAEVPAAIEAVRQTQEWLGARLAVEWVALTACRSNEAREATWAEIDRENAVWVIPSGRTKTAREHRVPLSRQALEVLDRAAEFADPDGLLFRASKGGTLSGPALRRVVAELPTTIHGFRSSFRVWAELNDYPSEMAEAALNHANRNAVEASYLRPELSPGAMAEKRRPMLRAWADHIAGV